MPAPEGPVVPSLHCQGEATMLREGIVSKRYLKLIELWATPEAGLLAASIAWCAVLGCGLAYLILSTAL